MKKITIFLLLTVGYSTHLFPMLAGQLRGYMPGAVRSVVGVSLAQRSALPDMGSNADIFRRTKMLLNSWRHSECPYKVLGVSQGVTYSELKKAHKEQALLYHPDNKATGNRNKFEKVQEAYEYLQDPVKQGRSVYTHSKSENTPSDFEDIFSYGDIIEKKIVGHDPINGCTWEWIDGKGSSWRGRCKDSDYFQRYEQISQMFNTKPLPVHEFKKLHDWFVTNGHYSELILSDNYKDSTPTDQDNVSEPTESYAFEANQSVDIDAPVKDVQEGWKVDEDWTKSTFSDSNKVEWTRRLIDLQGFSWLQIAVKNQPSDSFDFDLQPVNGWMSYNLQREPLGEVPVGCYFYITKWRQIDARCWRRELTSEYGNILVQDAQLKENINLDESIEDDELFTYNQVPLDRYNNHLGTTLFRFREKKYMEAYYGDDFEFQGVESIQDMASQGCVNAKMVALALEFYDAESLGMMLASEPVLGHSPVLNHELQQKIVQLITDEMKKAGPTGERRNLLYEAMLSAHLGHTSHALPATKKLQLILENDTQNSRFKEAVGYLLKHGHLSIYLKLKGVQAIGDEQMVSEIHKTIASKLFAGAVAGGILGLGKLVYDYMNQQEDQVAKTDAMQ